MQKISFESNDLTIRGGLALPDTSNNLVPGVVTFHGLTSSANGYMALIETLAANGIAGLAISMRGHGESDGDFDACTVAEATNDALAAYDFLVSQPGIDASRIGMVGASVGAILVGLATRSRDIASILFRAPAAYTEQMMQLSMADILANEDILFHQIKDLGATPAGQAIANFEGSLLVVASEKDAIIPPAITEGYIAIASRAQQKELLVIKDANHGLTETHWRQTFNDAALEWFRKTLLSH